MIGARRSLPFQRQLPADSGRATVEVHHVAAGVRSQIDRAPRKAAVVSKSARPGRGEGSGSRLRGVRLDAKGVLEPLAIVPDGLCAISLDGRLDRSRARLITSSGLRPLAPACNRGLQAHRCRSVEPRYTCRLV